MTDPWIDAADTIMAMRAEKRRLEEETRRNQIATEAANAKAATTAYQEMKDAIAEAVPALTTFLAQRGAAAQRLLSACGDNALIMFGDEREGDFYSSVFLHGTGLRYENGMAGRYSSVPAVNRPATPKEGVEAFAYYGEGCDNPQKVRDIVGWLTAQVDAYARSNY